MSTAMAFFEGAKKQFAYYRSLGEKSMAQVGDDGLFFQYNEESNSIAVIVQHIAGNMLSRWTDFLNSDGEKEWRNRDSEFGEVIKTREELMQKWNEGWACLEHTLNGLTEEDLSKTVYIRAEAHSVPEAIQRQLAHYPYHVGQMVFIAKMVSQKEWETLSIARNKSADFNSKMFGK